MAFKKRDLTNLESRNKKTTISTDFSHIKVNPKYAENKQ